MAFLTAMARSQKRPILRIGLEKQRVFALPVPNFFVPFLQLQRHTIRKNIDGAQIPTLQLARL